MSWRRNVNTAGDLSPYPGRRPARVAREQILKTGVKTGVVFERETPSDKCN